MKAEFKDEQNAAKLADGGDGGQQNRRGQNRRGARRWNNAAEVGAAASGRAA